MYLQTKRLGIGTMIVLVFMPVLHLFAFLGSLPYGNLGDIAPDFDRLLMGHWINFCLLLLTIAGVAGAAAKKRWALWFFLPFSVVLFLYSLLPTPSSPGLAGIAGLILAFLLYRQRQLLTG